MDTKLGYLLLEDGTVFRGRSVAADGAVFGEAVFTTGMSGYQETVTDPSDEGQLICFTAPMVGNYGVNDSANESDRPHATAVVMRALGGEQWASWLRSHGLVALEGVDTRSLVLRLRAGGAMQAATVSDERNFSVAEAFTRVRAQPVMEGLALVSEVSTKEPYTVGKGDLRVAVVDYGTKRSIVGRLNAAGAGVNPAAATRRPRTSWHRSTAWCCRMGLGIRSRCARRPRSCATSSAGSRFSGSASDTSF